MRKRSRATGIPEAFNDYANPLARQVRGDSVFESFRDQANKRFAAIGVDLGFPVRFPAMFPGQVNMIGQDGGRIWNGMSIPGGILLASGSKGSGNYTFPAVARIDPNTLEFIWEYVISDLGWTHGTFAAVSATAEAVYAVGTTAAGSDVLVKLNRNDGSEIWKITIPDGYSVSEGWTKDLCCDDQNVYVSADTGVFKFNSAGALLWTATFAGQYYQSLAATRSICVDDNGVYVAVHPAQYFDHNNWDVKKLSKDTGSVVWSDTLSGPTATSATAIDAFNNLIAVTGGVGDRNTGAGNWRTEIRSASSGGVIWMNQDSVGDVFQYTPFDVALTANYAVTVGGYIAGDAYGYTRLECRDAVSGSLTGEYSSSNWYVGFNSVTINGQLIFVAGHSASPRVGTLFRFDTAGNLQSTLVTSWLDFDSIKFVG